MPKIKHIEAFTHVLVNRNFDDDSIKKEQARMDKSLSNISLWDTFLDTQQLIRS